MNCPECGNALNVSTTVCLGVMHRIESCTVCQYRCEYVPVSALQHAVEVILIAGSAGKRDAVDSCTMREQQGRKDGARAVLQLIGVPVPTIV